MRHRDTILSTATFFVLALLASAPWSEVRVHPGVPIPSRSAADAPGAIPLARISAQNQALPSDLAILLALLEMEDPGIREHAATALGKRGDARAVPPLVFVLTQDPDARVREHAATALGRLGDGRARLSLVGTMRNDPDPVVREHAVEAVGRMGSGESSDALLETMHGRRVDRMRRWAAEVLRKIGNR
jgi:HEAT repeat protein